MFTFCFLFANLGFTDYILVASEANVKEVKLKISLFLLNAINMAILIVFASTIFNIESHLLFILIIIRTFFDSTFFALILPYFNTIAKINIFYAIGNSIIAIVSYIFKLSLLKFLALNIGLGLFNFIQCSYIAKINYLLVFKHFKRFYKMLDKGIFAYVGATLAYFLYSQMPSLYVSIYQAKEQAALYFSAFTIAAIIGLLISAQAQKMMPEMIKAPIEQVEKIIKKNLRFLIFITSLLFLFMVIWGKSLLLILYGQDYYSNGYLILLILMLGNISIAEAAVYGTYITASGNQKKKIPMQLEAISITILGLFILHKFGIYGAAVSFLLTAIFISFRYTIFTLKLIQSSIKENTWNSKI